MQEGLHFTSDQIEELGNIAQRYDEEEIQELGGLLTSFLADGLQFHAALNEALQSPKVTDAKGRVFLTYFAGLSAIQDNEDPELFSNYRSGLYRFAEAKEASLNRAWLVTNDDRDLLRFVLAAQQDDDSEAARRGRKVDLLVDLMQEFTTEE